MSGQDGDFDNWPTIHIFPTDLKESGQKLTWERTMKAGNAIV